MSARLPPPAQTCALLCEAGWHAFVAGRFHAAHESWESAWLATPDGPLREGLRGLVQWAVAAHHLQRSLQQSASRDPRALAAAESVRVRAAARLADPGVRAALQDPAVTGLLVAPAAPHDAAALAWALDAAKRPALLQLAPKRPGLHAAAVLLAGGHGRRAGGPKALKVREGELLWRWQLRRMREVGCAAVVAVLHPDAWNDPAPPGPDEPAVPADPDAPQWASLLLGLRQVQAIGCALPVFVLPVDCPCPSREVWLALRAASLDREVRAKTWSAARPCVADPHQIRCGHPVLLATTLWREVLAQAASDARLDHLLAGLAPETRLDVGVADGGVLANFNRDGLCM